MTEHHSKPKPVESIISELLEASRTINRPLSKQEEEGLFKALDNFEHHLLKEEKAH